MTPWQALCVDLIGPYTLRSKDRTSIDFMCITMNNPATSWFEIVELPTVTKMTVSTRGKGKKVTCDDFPKESEATFDKSSAQITNLMYKTWFSRLTATATCSHYRLFDKILNNLLFVD
jgi:hypothetical protein